MTRIHQRRLALCGVLALALGPVLLGRASGQPVVLSVNRQGNTAYLVVQPE